jgi:NSS family neurotransmitter:Na+ symporter
MGTPVMGFLQDEFGWKEKNAAWMFGFAVLILGLPTVLFFNNGVFDEYDYWAGTVSLVFFAFIEIILFSWVFGIKKGWQEITEGADIKVPNIFKFIIKFITPLLLGWVFFASFPGIKDEINHKKSNEKINFFSSTIAIKRKITEQQKVLETKKDFSAKYLEPSFSNSQLDLNKELNVSTYLLLKKQKDLLEIVDNPTLRKGKIAEVRKSIFYKNISRVFLVILWLGIAYLVHLAAVKRKKNRL